MRLVTVAIYTQAHQAHLARALLEDAGIPCAIANEYGFLLPAFSPTGDGVRLRVLEDANDEAQTVLRAAGESDALVAKR